MVTGIQRRLNDTTETQVRLEWFAPEPRAAAVHFGDSMPLVVRPGSTVAIRFDGDAAVLDPAAMAVTPGAPTDAGRRSRKVPDQGVDDTSLDMRVLSRLKKWTPETAVVSTFKQVQTFGMPMQNSHIVVRRADGRGAPVQAMSTRDGFDLSMSPESAVAIEGITVERCASIEAALTKRRLPPNAHDEVAARDYGVPAGRWSAIKDAWRARIRSDWRVGVADGQAYADGNVGSPVSMQTPPPQDDPEVAGIPSRQSISWSQRSMSAERNAR